MTNSATTSCRERACNASTIWAPRSGRYQGVERTHDFCEKHYLADTKPATYRIWRGGRRIFEAHSRDRDGRQVTATGDTIDEAQAVLRKKLGPTYVKPARRPSVDEGKMTLTDFFETRFMPNVAMKPKTELGRLGDFRNHIEPVLGDTRLDKLTVSQVVDWRTGLRAKGLKPSSQKRLDSLLHRVLEVARFERRIDANPAARLPRGSDHEEAGKSYVWLDPGQVRELTLAIQPPNYQALVATMYATGIRMGEASGLRVRNLDLDNGTLTVSENAVLVGGKRTLGTPKTRGSRRTIALHPAIAAGLRQHLAYFSDATDPDAWVFTNGRGNPVRGDNFGRALKRAAKVAKVPAPKPKDFRDMLTHTLELQGASEREKAAILGHTRLTTTAGYGGGPDLARLRALAEAQDVPALAVALGS